MNLGGHVTPGAVGYRRMSLQSIRCEPERIDFAVSGETLLWLRSVKLVCHPMNRARVRIGAGNPQDLLDALSQSIEMRSGLPVGAVWYSAPVLILRICAKEPCYCHVRDSALPRPALGSRQRQRAAIGSWVTHVALETFYIVTDGVRGGRAARHVCCHTASSRTLIAVQPE
jgi:hypothetical protein